ncbi:MAG: restriction endonuclease subunit S [FCB group bacterium]|jgi:type I restriction enzyme S subunit|nr:restriction endonuclease subunit S [FCB group bacterium]
MKLETFFEKFDLIADAPNAVSRLREIVLWSAFAGKFSGEQQELNLPAEFEVEGRPILPPVPSSWQWKRGKDIFYVIRGVSYKKNDASDTAASDKIPLLRANNIGNGINFDELIYVPKNLVRDDQIVRPGDILIAMSSGSKKLVGKAAALTTDFYGSFGAFCGLIRNKSDIFNPYLALYFLSPQYTSWVVSAGRGIGINNLGKGDLENLPVPVPPLAEQKRVVAKVDELMALCDRLEAQQQERKTRHAALVRASLARFTEAPPPANLQFLFHPSYEVSPADLRKTILTLAVQGKLVPQDPNDEPVEELLCAISAEQERLVKARQIRRVDTVPLNEDDAPFAIPPNWVWTRLGKIGDWGSGSTPPRGNHALYGGNIPWLKSGELNDNQSLASAEETVTELALKTCSFRLNKPGDVLLAMYGATIGKAAILSAAAVTNQAVCGCTLFPGVLNTYLFHYLVSQREAFHASSEGGAQPNISKVKIINHPFPLPPLAEQRRIVAKVEQLMALVDELEQQLAASRATAEKLLTALVAELANGKNAHASAEV